MPTALVLYHFLYPDDVVSSLHMSELCAGLTAHGWDVTAMPCNRGCRDESKTYGSLIWKGVDIRRVWRPGLSQASKVGRIINSAWMVGRWSLQAFSRGPKPDVVIIGTDPIFGVIAAFAWKRVARTQVAHWAFDVHPEAAVAEGMFQQESHPVRLISWILAGAYRCCDTIVDLGGCMRTELLKYDTPAQRETIVPWALVEPPDPAPTDIDERRAVFGNARLALLYSGNFGLAHQAEHTVALARKMRTTSTKLVFSVRGNREEALRSSIGADDTNIAFVPFAKEAGLSARLSCADVHVVSLRPSYTGKVAPSKFFGALAVGRPVLFEGHENSAIAKWIREYEVGWVLGPNNQERIAAELQSLVDSPRRTAELRRRCHSLYHEQFSRAHGIAAWDAALRSLNMSIPNSAAPSRA